jgi:tetratricopeptide (TPR) repeat protein
LARDEKFLQAQASAFPGEPQLPLGTIQAAIEGATRIDDAGGMAEFVLEHTRRLTEIGSESPLDALRAGDLERAWELADLYDPEVSAVWHLWLARELKDAARSGEAIATLERLRGKDLPHIQAWQGYAGYFLKHAIEVSESLFLELQRRVLKEDERHSHQRRDLCEYLAGLGRYALAIEVASDMSDPFERGSVLILIARKQAEAGDLNAALAIVNGIDNEFQRKDAMAELASARARGGDIAGAFELVPEESLAGDSALGVIASEQARAHQFEAATRTASAIKWAEAQVGAFVSIASEQVNAGDRYGAVQTFAAARQCASAKLAANQMMDVVHARVLLQIAVAEARAGDRDAARASFEDALDAVRHIEGWGSREDMQAKAAGALAEAGEFDAALAEAERAGSYKHDEGVLLVVEAMAKSGRLDLARAAARRMEKEDEQTKALAAIARAEADRNMFDEAFATASEIEDMGPNGRSEHTKVLTHIALALARSGRTEQARKTFDEALTRALERDRWPGNRHWTFLSIAQAQEEGGFSDSARVTLAAPLLREGRDRLDWEASRADMLSQVAEAVARAGATDEAKALFAAAVQVAENVPDDVNNHREHALQRIATAQVRSGFHGDGVETVRIIEDEIELGRALSAVSEELGRAGDIETAVRIVEGIRAWERASTLSSIAKCLAVEKQDVERARNLFAAAIEAAQSADSFSSRNEQLKICVTAQLESLGVRDALETARLIAGPVRDETLLLITKAQAEAGDIGGAKETAQTVSREFSYQEKAMAEVAAALGKGGESAAALEITRSFTGSMRAWTLSKVAAGLWRGGAREDAAGLYDAAVEESEEIKSREADAYRSAKALEAVVIAQAEAHDFDSAIETLKRLEWPSLEPLIKIPTEMARAGRREDAVAAFNRAFEFTRGLQRSDEWYRARNLTSIAVSEAELGFGEHAVRAAQSILTERNKKLVEIARSLADAGDRENFKALLIPCSYYMDAAYSVCGLLAQMFPEQATKIAAVVAPSSAGN